MAREDPVELIEGADIDIKPVVGPIKYHFGRKLGECPSSEDMDDVFRHALCVSFGAFQHARRVQEYLRKHCVLLLADTPEIG